MKTIKDDEGMNSEAKFADTYRIGYRTGYNNGIKDALSVFKSLQAEYDFRIDDKEFYLALEDLKDGQDLPATD